VEVVNDPISDVLERMELVESVADKREKNEGSPRGETSDSYLDAAPLLLDIR
jgi:hypothetical protein